VTAVDEQSEADIVFHDNDGDDDNDDNDDNDDENDDDVNQFPDTLKTHARAPPKPSSAHVASSLPPLDAFFKQPAPIQERVGCPLCEASFASAQAAQQHYDTTHDADNGDSPRVPSTSLLPASEDVVCPICSRTFASATKATLHINGHFDPKPAALVGKAAASSKPVRKSASARAMQRSKATKKAKTMMKNYFKPPS